MGSNPLSSTLDKPRIYEKQRIYAVFHCSEYIKLSQCRYGKTYKIERISHEISHENALILKALRGFLSKEYHTSGPPGRPEARYYYT